jgi:hypothetical protein
MTVDATALERYDPKQLIRQALQLEAPESTSARECVFLWLMSLGEDIDPAEAAAALLPLVLAASEEHPLRQDLATELGEVSRHPRASLQVLGRNRSRPSKRRPAS